MLRYRTEIVVSSDRYVCLQLPDDLPEGLAIVTVHYPNHPGTPDSQYEADPDREDIEWWEEFDDQTDPDPA